MEIQFYVVLTILCCFNREPYSRLLEDHLEKFPLLALAAHILKLEQYREDWYGPCTRMTCKFIKCSIFLKKEREDAVVGGRGIRVSSQLGHLPGTSGGPRTPKEMGGTPSNQVGRGAWGQ